METPMPGLGFGLGGERRSGLNGYVAKGSVLLIEIQRRGRRIVGNIDIGPAVVVQVGGSDAQAISPHRRPHTGLLTYIGKGSVAVVVVENISTAGQSRRTARHKNSLVSAWSVFRFRSGLQIEVDIVGDEEIEMTILVVIDERCNRYSSGSWVPVVSVRLARDIGEGPVSIVAIERILAVVGDK
jgi:hypothetical protein